MDGDTNDLTTKLRDQMLWWLAYEKGIREPRYQVPAIRVEVGYEFEQRPAGLRGYCWICSEYLLWTYWPLLGRIVEERADA